MTTLQDLLDQRHALERQIRNAQGAQKSQAVAQIRQIMADNGLTVADLANVSPSRKRSEHPGSTVRRPVAAKYRHPESGLSWSGRGLKPNWLRAELESGKSLSDFAL